jgi:hypothetical protein
MPWSRELTDLCDVLASLYRDTPEKCPRLIEDAGLNLASIDLRGSPQVTWRSILSEADKHGKVPLLLEVVSREYGDNQDFLRARAAYLTALEKAAQAVQKAVGAPKAPPPKKTGARSTRVSSTSAGSRPRQSPTTPLPPVSKPLLEPPAGPFNPMGAWRRLPAWLRFLLAAAAGALACGLLLALFGAPLGCAYQNLPETFRLLLFGALFTGVIIRVVSWLVNKSENKVSLRLAAFAVLGAAVVLFVFIFQRSTMSGGQFTRPCCPPTPTPTAILQPTANPTGAATVTLNPPQPTPTNAATATSAAASASALLPSMTPIPTLTPTASPPAPHLTRQELNELFGADNWFCFPDRQTGIGLYKSPPDFTVSYPLRYIDAGISSTNRYNPGDPLPAGVAGTAELELPVPPDECPTRQIGFLTDWRKAQAVDSAPIDHTRLDGLYGKGSWACLFTFPSAISLSHIPASFVVAYPVTAADQTGGAKYGVGDQMPAGGGATLWLAGALPLDQCPFKLSFLDRLDSLSSWVTHVYTDGSVITSTLVAGPSGNAVQLSFHLPTPGGWGLINRPVDAGMLAGKLGFVFTYKGSGSRDTLEMKLIDSDGVTFGSKWNAATNTQDAWKEQQVSFDQFTCWWTDNLADNHCPAGAHLNPQKAVRLEFAVSVKPGDDFDPDLGASGVVSISALRLAAPGP